MYAYHRRATISGDSLAHGGRRVGTIVDREVSGNCPFGSTYGLGGLIELGCHIEIVDCGGSTVDTIETDQGVDFKVGEVEVDVDGVKAGEEIYEYFLLLFGYVFEKGLSPHVTGREWSGNANIKPKGFGVDIANVDTTLVSEKDRITLAV